MIFEDLAEDAIGAPCMKYCSCQEKKSWTEGTAKYLTRTWDWEQQRVPVQATSKSNTFSFNAKTATPFSTQRTNGLLVFGADAKKLKVLVTSRSSKSSGETEPSYKPSKRKLPRPKKTNSYVIRDQTMKIEETKWAQRKTTNRKRRQQQKLGRVLTVNEFLQKKFFKKPKSKKKRSNEKEQTTTKLMRRSTRITYTLKKEDPSMFCVEKRQKYSPAVVCTA